MTKSGASFNDAKKAEIFVRDRAICCFSGANLWLLDAPLRVGWQSDWADHKKPISRGGSGKITNGICASHTFNMKKRNNSADTTYLFEKGHPTELYYMIHGTPSPSVMERLLRLSKLEECDWYFNRAINWIFEAFNDRWYEPDYVRKAAYWFDAAYNKFVVFQRMQKACPVSLEDRGIITNPTKSQNVLLSLRDCESRDEMEKKAMVLLPQYGRNSNAWCEYFEPHEYVESTDDEIKHGQRCDRQRKAAYKKASKNKDRLTEDTFECIEADYRVRFISI